MVGGGRIFVLGSRWGGSEGTGDVLVGGLPCMDGGWSYLGGFEALFSFEFRVLVIFERGDLLVHSPEVGLELQGLGDLGDYDGLYCGGSHCV